MIKSSGLKSIVRSTIMNACMRLYRCSIPGKVNKIRRKEKIRVVFPLYDISKWKTEHLYLAMKDHPRFEPEIVMTVRMCDTPSQLILQAEKLKKYLDEKGYPYLESTRSFGSNYDIVIYQEPYPETMPPCQDLYHNLDKLHISVCYGTHITCLPFEFFQPLHYYAWFDCYENEASAQAAKSVIGSRRHNILVTGLPMADTLLDPHSGDPWKVSEVKRKRIIYAPHHSLDGEDEAIHYGTILKYGDFILNLARRHAATTQWAFKPHPLLRVKLEKAWGKSRTDAYYEGWQKLENAQIETGDYSGLFRHSDAMIHDSCSFVTEYMYADRPVMFLNPDPAIAEEMNSYARKALEVSESTHSESDIEAFVERVIAGEDLKAEGRKEFIKNYMMPPRGKSTSENIIDAILGTAEFSRY